MLFRSRALGLFNGASIVLLGLAPFIVTLALMGMARGLTLQFSQGETVYDLPESFTWVGGSRFAGIPVAMVVMLAVFFIGHLVLTKTTFGHKVYAIGGNRQAARLAGIRDGRVLIGVYAIAGLTAGLAAIVMVGRLGSATPTAGVGLELQVIAAVIIGGTSLYGGKGSLLGTLIGVLLIAVINNGLTLMNVSGFLVTFAQGALIFIAVLVDALSDRRRARTQ